MIKLNETLVGKTCSFAMTDNPFVVIRLTGSDICLKVISDKESLRSLYFRKGDEDFPLTLLNLSEVIVGEFGVLSYGITTYDKRV